MSIGVVSLTCPVCGAPFSPNDENCSYCGSILVLRTNHPKINPATLNKHVIDEHIVDFRNNLRRDPHDSSAHYGLGVAYFNLGLTDDAVRELEEAARLMPENPNIQSQLAVVLKQADDEGRPGAASKLSDRIEYTLRLDSDNVDALLLKAETDASLTQTDRLSILERAFKIDPNSARTRYVEALLSTVDNELLPFTDSTLRSFELLSELDPENYGHVYFQAVEDQARYLSKSMPEEDVHNPMRSAEAIVAWKRLSSINDQDASQSIHSFLQSQPALSKSDKKALEEIFGKTERGKVAPSGRTRRITNPRKRSKIRPFLIGVVKGYGIVILIAALSNFFPSNETINAFLGLMVFVLPVAMGVREVRKPEDAVKIQRIPTDIESDPLEKDKHNFDAFLSILISHFEDRWNKEASIRMKLDTGAGGIGIRADNKRTQEFKNAIQSVS